MLLSPRFLLPPELRPELRLRDPPPELAEFRRLDLLPPDSTEFRRLDPPPPELNDRPRLDPPPPELNELLRLDPPPLEFSDPELDPDRRRERDDRCCGPLLFEPVLPNTWKLPDEELPRSDLKLDDPDPLFRRELPRLESPLLEPRLLPESPPPRLRKLGPPLSGLPLLLNWNDEPEL